MHEELDRLRKELRQMTFGVGSSRETLVQARPAERLRLVQQAPTAHREPEPVRPPRKAGQSKLPES